MKSIVTVKEQSYGIVELDVNKVIALVADKRMLLFESVYWTLDQDDFDMVSTIWHELKKTKRMKSIKEKAEEYANEQDLRMAYNGSCDNCRQGFVTGANYVLEQVDYILMDKDLDCEEICDELIALVEQLRK